MKEGISQKIEVLTNKASEAKARGENKQKEANINSINSLAENIKSKEQAETFKKMLSLL